MKKAFVSLIAMLLGMIAVLNVAIAAPSLTLQWDPPTHKIANSNCAEQGAELTADDLARVTYELSYRVSGTTDWTRITAQTTTLTVSNLNWSTSYDFVVGARFADGVVMCLTDAIQYQTPPEPAPGKCSNLRVLEPQL